MSEQTPRAVTVSLQKGGVGKTTIAVNLADRLAARDHDVLLVDADQQGHATEGVGQNDSYTADTHLDDVLRGDSTPEDIIVPMETFDLIPSNVDLDKAANYLRTQSMGHTTFKKKVIEPLLGEQYDYIVIDAPPNLGPMSDAALFGSQNVIIPLQMSEASVAGFEKMMTQQISQIKEVTEFHVLAIVPNFLSGNNEEKRILADLEAPEFAFSNRLPQFASSEHFEMEDSPGPGIRERVAFQRAHREGVPLSEYDPDSDMLPRLDELAEIVERGVADE